MRLEMSFRARANVLALLVLLPAGEACAPQEDGPGGRAAVRVAAAVDSIVRDALERDVMAGMAVVVLRGDDTLLARGYGRADVENDVPMSVDHVFQLASITKQFTAAAVLVLVEDGLVELDEPVTRYLPDAPVQGRPVTVRQLLAHTSGVPDVAESPRLSAIKRLDLPPDSVLALIDGTPLYFEPGDQMRYSNTGFLLAGQLIERVSGAPYAALVEERVLRPAGAERARFCDPEAMVPRLARGYAAGPDGLRPAPFISPRVPFSAGGFCGTAGDLVAWNAALHGSAGGPVLSPGVYAEMTGPATVRDGRRTRYGLGLGLGELAGRRALWHGGDIDGFTTFTAYLPNDSLNVTVLINTQGPTRPDAVAAATVVAALGELPEPDPGPAPPDLEPFAGVYGGDVVVEAVGEGESPVLRLTRGPMPPALLRYAGSDDRGWTFTDGRARYAFVAPPPGGGPASPAVWADLGVALVRWERRP
jgi:D-alanyl-D-alanine carboxypeptidase